MTAPDRAVPFLKAKLEAALPQSKRLNQLLTDLDSDRFGVRQKATTELAKLGVLAEPALRKVLAEKPTLEVRHRVEKILKIIAGDIPLPAAVRILRAVEVLEYINTPDARQALQSLGKGEPASLLAQEAKASLQRLAKRPVVTP
jgi:hypothetical protein